MATISPAKAEKTQRWPQQGEWTYDDYTRLPDNDVRYEVIRGELYMSPAPTPKHQQIITALLTALQNYLEKRRLGRVYPAPVDVRLVEMNTVIQPDILFIAQDKLDMIKDNFIEGVPDLVVEVISPSSRDRDRRVKFHLYAEAGVKEYWLIEPDERKITVCVLRGQAFAPMGPFGPQEKAESELLPGFAVAVGQICPA